MFGVLFVFALMETFRGVLAVITITDSNFASAISTCLGTNPVDGLCLRANTEVCLIGT